MFRNVWTFTLYWSLLALVLLSPVLIAHFCLGWK